MPNFKHLTIFTLLSIAGSAWAQQTTPALNPFTGKTVSIEEKQNEVEKAKLQTQLLEEQLKQTNIQSDIENLPVRKKHEIATLVSGGKYASGGTAAVPDLRSLPAIPEVKIESSAPSTVKSTSNSKKNKKAAAAVTEGSQELAEQKKPQKIVVTGVLSSAGKKSVVLNIDEKTVIAQEQENTPVGKITAISDQTIAIDGKPYPITNAVINTIVVSDAKPIMQDVKTQTATPSSKVNLPAIPNLSSKDLPALLRVAPAPAN